MYPNSKFNIDLIRKLLSKSYWPIYGTMKILEDFDKYYQGCENRHDCPETLGVGYSYLALMIYMIIVNVLLVNLLIAMFRYYFFLLLSRQPIIQIFCLSSTYQRIEENADEIWKFQRYNLVYEYVDFPMLAPPFNLIIYAILTAKYTYYKITDRAPVTSNSIFSFKGIKF